MGHKAPLSPLLATVRAALGGGSGTIAKHFLQYRGLARGATDSIDQLAERIVSYVDTGKLTAADIKTFVRELREYGDKRVYLFKGDPAKLKKVTGDKFPNLITDLEEATLKSGSNQHVNYALVDSEQIRISYSETHRSHQIDLAASTINWVHVSRIVVIEANKKSGFVTVSLDAPGDQNPHGERSTDYFTYYLDRAKTDLACDLVSLDLYNALLKLEKNTHKDIVRLANRWATTTDGLDVHMESNADMRDAQSFWDSQGTVALRKKEKLAWLASAKPQQGSQADGLIREIRTEIYASPGMIRFTANTLSQEVAYVIDQVRKLA